MSNNRRALALFLVTAVFVSLQIMHNTAQGYSTYFTNNCAGCHDTATGSTCNGCHHHGPVSLNGTTSKASYAPGETVSVTISGGNKSGWVRAILYDQNNSQVAISSGNDSGQGSSTTFPAILSAPAPSTPGTYTWKAAWYGNSYDSNNPNANSHGEVAVNTNSFTVTAAAPAISTVTPDSLPQGAASQSVTITGTNLTGGAVSFSNAGVTGGAATVSATSITLPVSVALGAATGAGTVTVTTAGGSISSAFTVTVPNATPMAMIGSTGYPSLSAAYLAAASGAVIDLLSTDLTGDLAMDQGKDITLRGGFDPAFSSNTGQPTGLVGLLTIASGSLTMDNVAVK